ncbi:MAG: ATP-binding protein [Lachnospiraceae bacterium]|nr:ATP-binding protein [Lachnospiraceae bacterium]
MMTIIRGMVLLGSMLMVYNIYGFIKFASTVGNKEKWWEESNILRIPIVLLILFLLGYLIVGLLGKPDIVVSLILLGGSILVFVMYLMLSGVTKRIKESDRLEAELMAAEQSSRARTSFLASMSHEMRTPMNVILGLSDIALKKPDLSPDTRDHLIKISRSGKHLLDTINNILELQDIDSEEMAVRHEEFSLDEMTGQISAIVGTLCEEKGLTYIAEVAEGARGSYMGDAVLLKQALMEMTDNAVKYTDAPGKVTFSAEPVSENGDKKTIRFSISDTGIGIKPEFMPKVFDLFSQEDSTSTTRFGGSGLGLAVAKKIITRLGGQIEAASDPGAGTVFTVTVPLEVSLRENAEEPVDELNADETEELAGCRILVVDDIDENAEIEAELLELEGAESDRAENGQVAVTMFRESKPFYYDAILMDLRMPVMDGMDAARAIRGLDREDAGIVPIIAVTANTHESDIKGTVSAGMNMHLAKPVDADLMYETLKEKITGYKKLQKRMVDR